MAKRGVCHFHNSLHCSFLHLLWCPSLVSAVSSISSSVSALLLPALCLMCAPCILTVVDFSAYGRSDSTRHPSLAALCKCRPGRGGREQWWLGLELGRGGLDCNDDVNECNGFLSFASLGADCGCLRTPWEQITCFAIHWTDMPHQLLIFFKDCNLWQDSIRKVCLSVYDMKWTWNSSRGWALWMTSALSNSLEITNMHVQGVSWIFVK